MLPTLSWDVISLIAEQIYLNDVLNDLLSFCLVSHDFHDASISWLYRRVNLSVDGTREMQLIVDQIGGDKAKYVHEICISPGAPVLDNKQISPLESLIRKLPALRRFIWGCTSPISNRFLEYLSQAESVCDIQLFYDVKLDFLGELPPPSLSGNPKLTALDLRIQRDTRIWGGNSNLQDCQMMIVKAPALKSLSLALVSEPYGVDFATSSVRRITFSPNQKLPAVESLVLRNCLIHRDQVRCESPLQLFKMQTLRLRMIFLESLSVFLADLLLEKQVLRLKNFEISESYSLGILSFDHWQTALSNFLHAFTGLEELILYGSCALSLSLSNTIADHGETLKTLKVHNSEMRPDLFVTAEDIKVVCDICPNLQELTLDISRSERSNGFDESMLNNLQAFSQLRKLEIFTPLTFTIMQLFKPVVDASFVQNAAIRLRGRRLKKLLIHVGEKTTVREMWRLPEEYQWENRHRSFWHIQYLDHGQGFGVKETAQDAYDIELMELTDYLGLPHDPPREWSAFKVWNDRLVSHIRSRVTRKESERDQEEILRRRDDNM